MNEKHREDFPLLAFLAIMTLECVQFVLLGEWKKSVLQRKFALWQISG